MDDDYGRFPDLNETMHHHIPEIIRREVLQGLGNSAVEAIDLDDSTFFEEAALRVDIDRMDRENLGFYEDDVPPEA